MDARGNQKTCFLAKTTVILLFNYEQWLVITASSEDLAAVVFVSNKFMSCVYLFWDVTKTGNGERGTGSGERGTGNGSLGTSSQRYPP